MRDIAARSLETPVFSEGWLHGAYTYCAVFILDGSELAPEQVRSDFGPLYEAVRADRHWIWPRGLARFVLVPVYCAASFSEATLTWLRRRRIGRWAIAMKPVLYNTRPNAITFREAMQNDTIFLYRRLSALSADGIARATRHFEPEGMPNKPPEPTA